VEFIAAQGRVVVMVRARFLNPRSGKVMVVLVDLARSVVVLLTVVGVVLVKVW
jgi:hypothetical protein